MTASLETCRTVGSAWCYLLGVRSAHVSDSRMDISENMEDVPEIKLDLPAIKADIARVLKVGINA